MPSLSSTRIILLGGVHLCVFRVDPDFAVADFDGIAGKRARRWAGEHAAIFGAEKSFVAGAVKLPLLVLIMHGAHQVGAALTVGGELVVAQSHEDARVMLGRVME